MQVEALEYLYAISTGKTFLSVAEDYNTTQSTLSKAIKKLEAELGFDLLEKSGRSVRLTPAGKQIVDDLADMAPLYERLKKHIAMFSCNKRTSIGLGIQGQSRFKQILSQFQAEHPDILLTVGTLHNYMPPKSNELAIVDTEDCDLLVIHKPAKLAPSMVSNLLYEDAVVAILAENSPLAQKPELNFADLENEQIILNPWSQSIIEPIMETTGIRLKNITVKPLSRADLVWSVLVKNCVTIFYASDMYMFRARNVVIRPIDDLPMHPVTLVSKHPSEMTSNCRMLYKYILDQMKRFPVSLTDCCSPMPNP